MNDCSCGVRRRRFWLWRDGEGVLHASGFRPSSGQVREVIAVTARDALLPMSDNLLPKHEVTDALDKTILSTSRCAGVAPVEA